MYAASGIMTFYVDDFIIRVKYSYIVFAYLNNNTALETSQGTVSKYGSKRIQIYALGI